MKYVGTTSEGVLVEMTSEEHRAFKFLEAAIEGRTQRSVDVSRCDNFKTEFAGALGAIRAFALTRFRVNEMRQLLDEYERVLNDVPGWKEVGGETINFSVGKKDDSSVDVCSVCKQRKRLVEYHPNSGLGTCQKCWDAVKDEVALMMKSK